MSNNLFKIKTSGLSMMPVLHDEDVVEVIKIPFSRINVNDIICFQRNSQLMTHRVVYKAKDHVVAKGDNNPFSDGKIKAERIIGKVDFIEREGKRLSIDEIYLFQAGIYFQEIKKTVKLLEKEKINFAVLKGLPLYIHLEKKYPKRIYADCDVLVSKKDISKVNDILMQKGYTTYNFSKSHLHNILKGDVSEVSYVKKVNNFPVVLDIHSEANFLIPTLGKLNLLYPQKEIEKLSSMFLERKTYVSVHGIKVPVLSDEDCLLFLLLHLSHHGFYGYNRYELIKSLLAVKKIKRDTFLKTVREFNLANFIYPSVILFDKYYPGVLLSEIKIKLRSLIPVRVVTYSNGIIRDLSIFDDEARISNGSRFKRFFLLSPRPIVIRMLVFLQPKIVYSIAYTLIESSLLNVLNFTQSKKRNRTYKDRIFSDSYWR